MRFIEPMTRSSIRLLGMLALIAGVASAEPAPRLNPARFINEISAFGCQEPEKQGIVFVGSSSIRLWPHLKEDFPGLPVVNRGFGGAMCNDLIVYFETVVARHEPKLLVSYAGGNDLTPEAHLSVDDAFNDYVKFLEMGHDRFPAMRVILISVKIAPHRAEQVPQVHQLNDRLIGWCTGKDWIRFVDCTSYLADPQGQPIPTLFVADQIHLTPEGYAGWRAILDPVLREEWAKVK